MKSYLIIASLILSAVSFAQPLNTRKMKNKILFVLTSHDKKGNTGEATGFYLSEVTHPWKVLTQAGFDIDFVSPKGGKPPVDGFDLSDPTNAEFWQDAVYREKIENTAKPSEIHPEDYVAIYYAGGHGAMWDLPQNTEIQKLASSIYENGGVVGAVCHGPAGIVDIKLSNGSYLVDGKQVAGFSNEEEKAVKLESVVPFLLEDRLIERGGKYQKAGLWETFVLSDQRLVTGQNPASATAVGTEMLKLLKP